MVFPALSAVLLVLGLITSVGCGLIGFARGSAARSNGSSDRRRLSSGSITASVVSALLLFGGLHSMLGANFGSIAASLSGTGFPRLDLISISLSIGNAIWPPLMATAIGWQAGASREYRGGRRVNAATAGVLLGELFAFWMPRSRNSKDRAEQSDEPEFEITMASGEEVEEEERQYIENILEMGDTTALEVMRPRTDVIALDADLPREEVARLVSQSRHSRFPVFEGSIDNVIGVLHLRNLFEYLAARDESASFDLRSLMLEPYFVPASRKVDDVLRDLQQQKGHMAIVLDEYGGTAGILTIEDLLEEIVGEIQDEHDDEAKQVHMQEDGSMLISAQMPIDDFNALLNTVFEAEDVETLGGYIIHGLGSIPKPGEKFTDNGVTFTVLSVGRNRIGRVRVEVSHNQETAEQSG